jgi:hypothetical protein
LWHAGHVADSKAAIEHLASVFLSGFQIPPDATPAEVWRYVESEFRLLAATLPDSEAAALEAAVRRRIDEGRYGRIPKRRSLKP